MPTTFIAGTILDAVDSAPIPGATIIEESNPSNTTQTNQEGHFAITVQDPATKLIVSFNGYQPLKDSAANLRGDDYLQPNDVAFADVYAVFKRTTATMPGTLITLVFILLFMKLFKVL